jgi:hypothetical protein
MFCSSTTLALICSFLVPTCIDYIVTVTMARDGSGRRSRPGRCALLAGGLHACSSEARRGGGEGGGLVEKIVHVPTWTHM